MSCNKCTSFTKCFNCRGPTGWTGSTGPTGAAGQTGPPGPTPVASCYGDYLYWNTSTNQWTVGSTDINLGCGAGEVNQQANAVAVGYQSGNLNQGLSAVAIGDLAGATNQGDGSIAIGYQAGQLIQKDRSIAIGYLAGREFQAASSIGIGEQAGHVNQKDRSVAIGFFAGQNDQESESVAIGDSAGENDQRQYSIAIGYEAGNAKQGTNAIAIGYHAGFISQGTYAIAIGYDAGVGSGTQGQHQNTIILNASGSTLNSNGTSKLFIKPIRTSATDFARPLTWDPSTGEVVLNTTKTFVIDHPNDQQRYLVHACLEGPEAGVYYRGKEEITNNEFVEISLPSYVDELANGFTVQITGIRGAHSTFETSEVTNGKFTVYGKNGKFFWHVYGKRQSIDVEPIKSKTQVKGDGPYRWI